MENDASSQGQNPQGVPGGAIEQGADVSTGGPTEAWVSVREFARQRGVVLSAVQKAIASGRVKTVKRDDQGRLLAVALRAGMAEYDANTDPAEAAKNMKFAHGAFALEGAAAAAQNNSIPGGGAAPGDSNKGPGAGAATGDGGKGDFQASRAALAQIQAQQAQLNYARDVGLLVSRDDVSRTAARRYRAIRDQLLSIPDRVAPQLAAERDAGQVHAILTAEIKQVLHGLSNDAAAEAAGGIAERVAD